jgi:molybdenum cofactor biosynthesis enzyme
MESGQIHMIDVTRKKDTERQAVARGKVWMKPATLELIRKGKLEKGDVLATAKTAGILAAKENLAFPTRAEHTILLSARLRSPPLLRAQGKQDSKWKRW